MQVNSRMSVRFSVRSKIYTNTVFPIFSLPQLSTILQNSSLPISKPSATTFLNIVYLIDRCVKLVLFQTIFCKTCKECHVKIFEKNHKAMPMTMKVSTFSTVFVFQVLIYENVTYLIYFWEQNFIFFELAISKGNGVVMSGVKMFLLFMIKAVAWEEGANQMHCSPGYSF